MDLILTKRMHQLFHDLQTAILDTFFPEFCLGCNTEGVVLCTTCVAARSIVPHQICIICKKPSLFGQTHPKCSNTQTPDGLLSLYDYHDTVIARSIIYGKYKFIPKLYSLLGEQLGMILQGQPFADKFKNFVVVPLPLAKSRQRWRGFNQAALLAEAITQKNKLEIRPALERHKNTKTQKDLNKPMRQKNVQNAFMLVDPTNTKWYHTFIVPKVKPAPFNTSVEGKNILLIDDVITTGSTLLEATKVLKRNGAKTVWCVTLARD